VIKNSKTVRGEGLEGSTDTAHGPSLHIWSCIVVALTVFILLFGLMVIDSSATA
jgi:hypothetical protein